MDSRDQRVQTLFEFLPQTGEFQVVPRSLVHATRVPFLDDQPSNLYNLRVLAPI